MSYLPALPLTGYAGWKLLQRTDAAQRTSFERSPEIQRDIAYFKDKIAAADTPEKLVADRRLLKVALGAFGLDEKLTHRAYMRKVLAEGSESPDAFANKISDPSFAKLAKAFGYGNLAGTNVRLSDFAAGITDAYKTRQYERAVGTVDDSMRLALNFKREMAGYASGASTTVQWFKLMGNQPIRKILEQGLGLPSEIGNIKDVDRQQSLFRSAATKLFGSDDPAVMAKPENMETILRNFFARDAASRGPGPMTPGYAALSLLQNASSAWQNLLNLSRS
ncbi:MAG: DUF1217 domain-containing protein [Paracoccaceae bacterium]